MIRIAKDISDYELRNELWSGAVDTFDEIVAHHKLEELIQLLEEMYQEPVDITTINDLLWFDDEFIYEQLEIGLKDEKIESFIL